VLGCPNGREPGIAGLQPGRKKGPGEWIPPAP
jgi:hypothetical protein